MKWYVYIVKARDNSLYAGITTDLTRRLNEHNTNNKLGAKYLKGKLPVKLVYKETYNGQVEAAKREREIKGWRREYKLKLIKRGSISK